MHGEMGNANLGLAQKNNGAGVVFPSCRCITVPPDNQGREAMERIGLACLKRKLAEKATRQWRNHVLKLNGGKGAFNLPTRKSKPRIRASLRTANKNVASPFYQFLSGHAVMAPFQYMLVVRQGRTPIRGVREVEDPDPWEPFWRMGQNKGHDLLDNESFSEAILEFLRNTGWG